MSSTCLRAVSSAVGWALGAAQRNMRSDALHGVVMKVHRETELVEVTEILSEGVKQLLQCDRATVFLADEENDELWSTIGNREISVPRAAGIAGSVHQSGEVLNIPDAYNDPRFDQDADREATHRTSSILACPLRSEGHIIGMLQAINKRSGPFTEEDEGLLVRICEQGVVAIDNARMLSNTQQDRKCPESMPAATTEAS